MSFSRRRNLFWRLGFLALSDSSGRVTGLSTSMVQNWCFFFSSRRRHTRSLCDWSSECALPISRVIAIGISTGGPNALQYMLSQLPGDFAGTIVIAQHMPEGFTEMFARRLDECCSIRVKEAASEIGRASCRERG